MCIGKIYCYSNFIYRCSSQIKKKMLHKPTFGNLNLKIKKNAFESSCDWNWFSDARCGTTNNDTRAVLTVHGCWSSAFLLQTRTYIRKCVHASSSGGVYALGGQQAPAEEDSLERREQSTYATSHKPEPTTTHTVLLPSEERRTGRSRVWARDRVVQRPRLISKRRLPARVARNALLQFFSHVALSLFLPPRSAAQRRAATSSLWTSSLSLSLYIRLAHSLLLLCIR